MKRLPLLLLGSILLCAGPALGLAAAPAVPAVPAAGATVTPAAAAPAAAPNPFGGVALAPSLLPGERAPQMTPAPTPLACNGQVTTTCNSCLYFGEKSSYQCTYFCINGVPHVSCDTCGEGCID
jgi:hypothetical protein